MASYTIHQIVRTADASYAKVIAAIKATGLKGHINRATGDRVWSEPDADAIMEALESDQCPECARSFGPNYRGPCEH